MELTVVTEESERKELHAAMEAYFHCIEGEAPFEEFHETAPRKVWIDFVKGEGMPFLVVDNRDGEMFEERFETLDGAMLYACDCYITCERQTDWDYMGAVNDRDGLDEKDERIREKGDSHG